MKPHILIATPSYAPGNVSGRQQVHAQRLHPDWKLSHFEQAFSALTLNMNAAWCFLLNHRHQHKITHFLMIHADVRPLHEDWLGVLMRELDRAKADVLSVIVPIKADTQRPETSTAVETGDLWTPQRLTVPECDHMPVTWTDPRLLFNTGLMLIKVGDWCEHLSFTIHDRIEKRSDGLFHPGFIPEDWQFARDCRQIGLACYVTRAIGVEHVGTQTWARR